jgi:hypothetical protein
MAPGCRARRRRHSGEHPQRAVETDDEIVFIMVVLSDGRGEALEKMRHSENEAARLAAVPVGISVAQDGIGIVVERVRRVGFVPIFT